MTASTIFHVQGGGQPADTGTMTSTSTGSVFEVQSTRYGPDHQISHFGQFSPGPSQPPGTTSTPFEPDEEVLQSIDVEKRKLHARIHTAGHIIGVAVHELRDLIGPVTDGKAMHYPESAFVECIGLIDAKHKDAIQAKVDEIVAREIPVRVHFWPAEEMKTRCLIPPAPEMVEAVGEGLLRAVDIEGLGAYPCGGTPTVDTGSCKMTIKKISRQKGISRISYQVV